VSQNARVMRPSQLSQLVTSGTEGSEPDLPDLACGNRWSERSEVETVAIFRTFSPRNIVISVKEVMYNYAFLRLSVCQQDSSKMDEFWRNFWRGGMCDQNNCWLEFGCDPHYDADIDFLQKYYLRWRYTGNAEMYDYSWIQQPIGGGLRSPSAFFSSLFLSFITMSCRRWIT